MKLPAAAARLLKPIAAQAKKSGIKAYIVGGCVRDWLRGRPNMDLDLSVEGDPGRLAAVCAGILRAQPASFDRFGTLRVVGKNLRIDLAACRRESYPQPASLPQVFPAAIAEDLFRRDFTINAMAVALDAPEAGVIDPYGGRKDLKSKILRVLHPESFRDDPTRVFRAARFLCRFHFKPSTELKAMADAALADGHAARLSRHRLASELLRVLSENKPEGALRLLREWGYLGLLHPSLSELSFTSRKAFERLGVMALKMGPAGGEFLDSLPLERAEAAPLREALRISREKSSPRTPVSAAAAVILRECLPRLPAGALKPMFLKGADLLALGLKPGEVFSRLLDLAARAQWEARLRTRGEALRWLKNQINAR